MPSSYLGNGLSAE